MKRFLTFSLTVGVLSCSSSAEERDANYVTVAADPQRNTEAAKAKNADGIDQLEAGDYPAAEAVLKEALVEDIFFGPAHNNLGKAYFHQKKYYLAAWEFQYAGKIMPKKAEPKNNLGLVFEAVGKLDEAVAEYSGARGLEPDNTDVLGNLARAKVKRGDGGEELRTLLEEVLLKDSRPSWSSWAREELARLRLTRQARKEQEAQP